MKREFCKIWILILLLSPSLGGVKSYARSGARWSPVEQYGEGFAASLDDIILDIYNAATEIGEVDYEQLQTDLYALHEEPINLNNTSDEELQQLYFLSPQQIDEILMYADKHPFESLYELRMIQSLADYEIRDLLPFVRIGASAGEQKYYAREVFAYATHEIITRLDARDIESYEGSDPMFVQARYRFDFQRRVTFGAQLRRPAGGIAGDLQYGAYLQLRDIGHLHTIVGGNFQASFGQGLVLAPVFHAGKSVYVQSAGQSREGLRYYSSADGEGLHGAGATLRWEWSKKTRLDASVLYSMKRANDSTWHHLIGANLTVRHNRLQVALTAIENIWSDSIRPYRNTAYNQHYFRGRNQAVIGVSARYNHGWFDVFGEVATSQNHQSSIINHPLRVAHWGFGTIVGSRFYPASGVSLVAIYRYYSPWFDNAQGYAFSETSRIGDENGGYVGFDITRWRNWRLTGYGDVFYFSEPKYGIASAPTIGYDAMAEMEWHKPLNSKLSTLNFLLRLRARQKGDALYSARAQFDWSSCGWSLRTTADANLAPNSLNSNSLNSNSLNSQLTYGISIAQDFSLDFSQLTALNTKLPLTLKLRVHGFDAREWANRIYMYEHDVLYAFSIPAVYGLGGRAYACLRWQIIPQIALYLRVSETVYARAWAAAHDRAMTRTDVHFLLRAKL